MNDYSVTLEAMPVVAAQLVTQLTAQDQTQAVVLGLSGNLGAGKTTLVQAIAAELGVAERLVSPTFVIMKQYATSHATFTTLVHIDAYRIEDVTELEPLHLTALLAQPQTLICIEWPENIAAVLPSASPALHLHVVDTQTRTLSSPSLTFVNS